MHRLGLNYYSAALETTRVEDKNSRRFGRNLHADLTRLALLLIQYTDITDDIIIAINDNERKKSERATIYNRLFGYSAKKIFNQCAIIAKHS